MNVKISILGVLLVPLLSGAVNTVQKDGLTISAASYTQDEQVLVVGGAPITGKKFAAKGLIPVWIDVTNNSDAPVALNSNSVSVTHVQKSALQKKFKSHAVLYPFMGAAVGCAGIFTLVTPHIIDLIKASTLHISVADAMVKACERKVKEQGDRSEKHKADIESKNVDGASAKLKLFVQHQKTLEEEFVRMGSAVSYAAALKRKTTRCMFGYVGLYLGTIATAVYSWWFLSRFNNYFDLELDKQLLQDVVSIEPGQTVKKLVVFEAENMHNTFALSVFDSSASVVKISCTIVL